MSSALRQRPAAAAPRTWGETLPELDGITADHMDPARIEAAMRDGYATGHAAGYEDGRTAGYSAGEAAGRATLEHERHRFVSALQAVGDQLRLLAESEAAVRANFEAAVVETALAVAEAILGRELAVNADPGRDAIARALAVAPSGAAKATVRLHPDDAARLGDLDLIAPGLEVGIVADHSVAPGDCILTMGDTSVDAGVATALERVRKALA
jgi:flagellar assembly protein FliH